MYRYSFCTYFSSCLSHLHRLIEDIFFFFQCWGSGSASGSISHKYWSGSGSFHHQAKIVNKTCFILFCNFLWLFIFEELCKCTIVSNLHSDPYVFGPPGSVSVSQRYGSEDPHTDPYQNVTDPQHWFPRMQGNLSISPTSPPPLEINHYPPSFSLIVMIDTERPLSYFSTLWWEFTSAQERCLTFNWHGLAMSLAYPSGGGDILLAQLISICLHGA